MANTKRTAEEPWVQQAAELMVRQGLSLRQAAMELDNPITVEEATALEKSKSFQKMLWAVRHQWYGEIAATVGRDKTSTIGQLQLLAQKLMDQGDYDKAAEVLFKVIRTEGWAGNEATVNVFSGLSAKDFEAIRKKLTENDGNAATNSNSGTSTPYRN